MPRKSRNIKNNNFYHVIIQGINREYIFDDNNNKSYYLYLLRKKLADYNSIVISYCIMDNHAHFLVYCEIESEISCLFQRINGSYSNYYNKAKNRVGYVFRDRFLSQEIYDRAQLINCIKYIHNNPVKALMVKRAEDYNFSSYKEFINQVSGVIDFNIINIFLMRISNINSVFESNDYDDNSFIDIKNFNRNEFYNEYLPSLNFEELNNDKKQMKKEIIHCITEMNVPVKEVAKVFGISAKTIYVWKKK